MLILTFQNKKIKKKFLIKIPHFPSNEKFKVLVLNSVVNLYRTNCE